MTKPWLDSLSEDWVSPRSSIKSTRTSIISPSDSYGHKFQPKSSRIPRRIPKKARAEDPNLSEVKRKRFLSQEKTLGLDQESNYSVRTNHSGTDLVRSLSASINSTQCRTINYKPRSRSLSHESQETPEWKKRLLHNEISYGERPDLFSGPNLESLFVNPSSNFKTRKKSTVLVHDGKNSQPPSNPSYLQTAIAKEDSVSLNSRLNIEDTPSKMIKNSDQVKSFDNDPLILSEKTSSHKNDSGRESKIAAGEREASCCTVNHDEKFEASTLRTISGHSISRNEKLSQIFLVKQSVEDGRFRYATIDLSSDGSQERLGHFVEQTKNIFEKNQASFSDSFIAKLSIDNENLAQGSMLYKISQVNCSQGPTNQPKQPSTSEPLSDESALLPEESMQASTPKNLTDARNYSVTANQELDNKESQRSQTPGPSPTKTQENKSNRTSCSPLKIFGTHDTFTNEKLLRRLSQFECELESNTRITAGNMSKKSAYFEHPQENENSLIKLGDRNPKSKIFKEDRSSRSRDMHKFHFRSQVPYVSLEKKPHSPNRENSIPLIPEPKVNLTANSILYPLAVEKKKTTDQKMYAAEAKKNDQAPCHGKINRPQMSPQSHNVCSILKQEDLNTPRKKNGDIEGKRLPKTPLVYPTPKRRRTLYTAEIKGAYDLEVNSQCDSLKAAHEKIQSAIDRDRKSPEEHDESQVENLKLPPEGPKFPISSKPYSNCAKIAQNGKTISAQVNQGLDDLPKGLIDNELSNIQTQADSRKSSVTTNDFIAEAKKIMANLRGQARSKWALSSVEELDMTENPENSIRTPTSGDKMDDSDQESTQEPFSRPPSREGAMPVSHRPKKQEDPAIIDHLRKYQENIDLRSVLISSLKSIAELREISGIAKQMDHLIEEEILRASTHRSTVLTNTIGNSSDIGITSESKDKKTQLLCFVPNQLALNLEKNYPSLRSNASSSYSTIHSEPTRSSKESECRRVIVPESVSHLIPEQLAGMVFDRERNTWIKKKSADSDKSNLKSIPLEVTEEDPFEDIPDLSIDESLERQRTKFLPKCDKENLSEPEKASGQVPQQQGLVPETGHEMRNTKDAELYYNSVSSQNSQSIIVQGSQIQAKATNTFSEEHDQIKHKRPNSKDSSSLPKMDDFSPRSKVKGDDTEHFEKEISIYEDRIHPNQTPKLHKQRSITISFSSPIASFIEKPEYQDHISTHHDQDTLDHSKNDSDVSRIRGKVLAQNENHRRSSAAANLISCRSTPIKQSLGGHHFPSRPVSRIDENDEISECNNNENQQNRSLSIVFAKSSTPARIFERHLTPRPLREIGTLTLTPLSDFTVNQVDESLGLNVSYLPQNLHFEVENSKKTLSSSIKELVEKITEVEPYEPFWEHLKEISLKGKQLKSLHKLEDFCERLRDLDISQNQISNLDGVPRTVQTIHINSNCLSDLTAWGHLTNLQYVDVSDNNLESLSSLKCLFHLRSLRADNNKIKSLEGIDQLGGLLTLRLRNNKIQDLNFKNTKLLLLTDLDLRKNNVSKLENIQQLRSLAHLDLIDNNLAKFSTTDSETMNSIKYLRLCGNNLESIYVGCFPNLRLLYLDRNRLGRVTGILKAKYLDSLSLREQRDSNLDPNILSEAFEVRKLFLSGNFLPRFETKVDYLNLQYLEMANCGLELLPLEFGTMLANVRVMNLNFNALTDIQAIFGVIRLKKLFVAGNRLTSREGLIRLLSRLPTLSIIDIRSNPLTAGFYSPMFMSGKVSYESVELDQAEPQEPYTLGKMNRIKDNLYASCLDMPTRMKRRIYEMNIISSAPRLKIVDGLPVDKTTLFTMDDVYHCMVEAGFLAQSQSLVEPRENNKEQKDVKDKLLESNSDDDKWQAEDSFA